MIARIGAAFLAGRGVYGSPRIHATLAPRPALWAQTVARLMRVQGLRAGRPRRHKPRTTDSPHTEPIAPNLLGRDFTATAPNRKWVADITGIPTRTAGSICPGSSTSTRAGSSAMRWTALAMSAWSRPRSTWHWAVDGRCGADPPLGPRQPVHQHGISAPVGRLWDHVQHEWEGEPYDNALMESFFSTLKSRMRGAPRPSRLPGRHACIFEYLEVFYNRQRLHPRWAIAHR